MTAFKPHGETTVEVRGRAVVLRPHSDLNEEEVERLLHEIATLKERLGRGPWGIIVVVGTPVLLTSFAEKLSKGAFPGLVAAGLGALAFVIPAHLGRSLIEAQVLRVVAQSPCPLKILAAEAEAEAWVATLVEGR